MGLKIAHVEELGGLLRQVPGLVDKLEGRQPGFHEALLAWLRAVETVLEANRLPVVSEVASLRGLLVQSARGLQNPEVKVEGRPSRRKVREATGAHVLHRCTGLLQALLRGPLSAIEDADRIAQQLAAVARAKGYVADCLREPGHSASIAHLKQRLSSDPDTAAAWVHMAGLVGQQDADILLDRSLPELS